MMRDIDATGCKNRGLLSLMRRHPHRLRADQQLRLAAYLVEHPVLETTSNSGSAIFC